MELLVCLAYHVCSMFLWYICEQGSPSIDTKIVSWPYLRFHCYEIKSVESFVKDFFFCATGCRTVSLNVDMLSVGPSRPEVMGLPTGLNLYFRKSVAGISEFLAGWEFMKAIF